MRINTTKGIALLVTAFLLGYGTRSLHSTKAADSSRKVTGLGGIFFKCRDPKAMRAWYSTHLGLATNQYGSVFEWRQALDPTQKGFTQWSPFNEKTQYFAPSTKEFMINYRVANMDALLAQLKEQGVMPVDSVQAYDYGKFVHLMDPEGNKIELWEPVDAVYDKMGKDMGYPTTK